MNKHEKIAVLRHDLARYGLPPDRPPVPLGHAAADATLAGGLRPGALHEVFGQGWGGGGFAALLAIRMTAAFSGGKGGPLFWIRPDYEALEYGAISPNGFLELGGDPRHLFLVRTRNAADALAAANDILACSHVGVVLLEVGGTPRCLDLVASRRLTFAAAESGATILLLREGAITTPSAALTRWHAFWQAGITKACNWRACTLSHWGLMSRRPWPRAIVSSTGTITGSSCCGGDGLNRLRKGQGFVIACAPAHSTSGSTRGTLRLFKMPRLLLLLSGDPPQEARCGAAGQVFQPQLRQGARQVHQGGWRRALRHAPQGG